MWMSGSEVQDIRTIQKKINQRKMSFMVICSHERPALR